MNTALTLALSYTDLAQIWEGWCLSLRPASRKTYGDCLKRYALWAGEDPRTAIARLLREGPIAANGAISCYRHYLQARDYAANTINLRLAALRSILEYAAKLGIIGWRVTVPSLPARNCRDTSGPGEAVYNELAASLNSSSARSARDLAILRLCYDCGLRRVEIYRLNTDDCDPDNRRIQIRGKGQYEQEWIGLTERATAALSNWLVRREIGREIPLFVRIRKGDQLTDERLHIDSITRLVRDLGAKHGHTVTPHGFRHSAITEVLDRTNGNIRAAKAFSRHKKPETLFRYDDNLAQLQAQTARLLEMK